MSFERLQECFIRGNVSEAIEIMKSVPEMSEYAKSYVDLYENEHYIRYDIPKELDAILLCYQYYFRNVFYLLESEDDAREILFEGLRETLSLPGATEEELTGHMKKLFEKNGYHVLFGLTQGHYGPYVWKETVPTTYPVELPNGTEEYKVNILKGFVFRSWMDYLTFGMFGTKGWASEDGVINCIETANDFNSEAFQVSFLKHEAQHAQDIMRYPGITPMELEYRAKLIELIYSNDPNLLAKFVSEADDRSEDNSHGMASARIKDAMGYLVGAAIPPIQSTARVLLEADDVKLGMKYN